jgi:pyroglutamyl-peptidase
LVVAVFGIENRIRLPSFNAVDHSDNQRVTMSETTEEKKDKIVLVVTAFGPFGGVDENPSNILIRELPSFLEEQPHQGSSKTPWKHQVKDRIQEMVIVETSAQGATEAMDELARTIAQMQESANKVFCLHLGVNVFGTGYHLEQCAYNDASFRIPDQRGYQPKETPILPGVPLGTPCHTSCNVSELVEQLSKAFPAVESKVSTDPGRFVCNYLYYTSLNKVQQALPDAVDGSLFLHIPTFERIPKEIQLEYLAELMRILTRVDLN